MSSILILNSIYIKYSHMGGVGKNATLKERKELGKGVTACWLPFSMSFGGGQQCTAHLIPQWHGAVPSRDRRRLGSPLHILVAGRVMRLSRRTVTAVRGSNFQKELGVKHHNCETRAMAARPYEKTSDAEGFQSHGQDRQLGNPFGTRECDKKPKVQPHAGCLLFAPPHCRSCERTDALRSFGFGQRAFRSLVGWQSG